MAETIGRAYIKILADGSGMPKSIEKELAKGDKAAEKAGRKTAASWGDGAVEGISDHRKEIVAAIDKSFGRVEDRMEVMGRQFGSNLAIGLATRIRKAFPELEKTSGELGQRMSDAFLADFALTGDKRFDFARRLKDAIGEMDEEMRKAGRGSDDFVVRLDAIGDGVGRAFGKGSRNNFLNFFGSLIGNLTRMPGLLVKAGTSFIDFGKSLGTAFTGAGDAFGGLIAVSGKIVPAIGGATVGLIGFVYLLGTVTSALLLTAGAAAALTSTIAFGLVGAVAPLVGLLGPLSLAGFAVAAAFIGMDEAAKKATKEAFEPLKDDLKALGDAARPGILDGITAAVENLEEPMQRLRPLFRVIGDSIGDFMDISSRIAFGPGFDRFVEVMSRTMPDTMRTLGRIVGHVFDGLAGMFATLQPFTSRFLDATNRIAANFDRWAISDDALNFFRDAEDSAKALLDFLRPVWNLTQEILSAGKDTGDSLFRSMGNAVQGWVDALRADPTILRDFFKDAKRMGEAIGDAVVAVGELIGALDTPTTRNFAIGAIEIFGDLVGAIADLVGWFGDLDGTIQSITITLGLAALAWGRVSTAILGAQSQMTLFAGNMRTTAGRLSMLGTAAKTAAGIGGLALLGSGMQQASQEGTNFGNVLQGILGGAGTGLIAGPWGALAGGLIGGAGSLVAGFVGTREAAEATREELMKAEGFEQAKADAKALSDELVGVIDMYGEVSRAAIESSFTSPEGELDQDIAKLRELGVSMDTIVSAAQGSPEALRIVNDALATGLDGAKTSADNAREAYEAAKDGWEEIPGVGLVKVSEERLADLKDQADLAATGLEDLTVAEDTFGKRVVEINGVMVDHASLMKELREELGLTRKEYGDLPKTVRTEFESKGLPETSGGVRRLIEDFKGLRNFRSIKMLARLEGVDLTRKDIRAIGRDAKLSPKQIKILMKLENVKGAKRDIRDVGKDAKDLGKQRPRVKVEVDDKPAKKKFDGIKNAGKDVDRVKVNPKAGLDDKEFNRKNKGVKDELDKRNRDKAEPKITVDNSQALRAINAVETSLNQIQDETVYINVIRRNQGGGGGNAAGGIFSGAQYQMLGEAGAEAIVPLSRPLAMVDPAVRELSAFAQGLAFSPTRETTGSTKTVDVGGITVISPQADPRAVAAEMMNHLVAAAY